MDKVFRTKASHTDGVTGQRPAAPPAHPWREALPVMASGNCTLREPVSSDAPALLMALGPHDLRDCAPLAATPTIAGVEALIASAHAHRAAGTAACWAIVPE